MSSFNEAFRVLCANVSTTLDQLDRPVVAVTSSKVGEGKTVTCAKLGATFAARGRRVVVVDLDLRDPGIHKVLGVHNRAGVTDVLQGRRKLGECLQYVKLPGQAGFAERGLFVVPSGPPVSEPSELLSTARGERMLGSLAAQADVVLVDTPPVLAVADTLTIGGSLGGAIVVIDARRSKAASVERARDLLVRNQIRIVGMVLNQVHADDAGVSAAEGYGYGDTPSR
jgi:capsular exopolysaccharide synthesis family protein